MGGSLRYGRLAKVWEARQGRRGSLICEILEINCVHVLLTGGYGCIGSWIVRQLLARGDQVWIYDLKADDHRLRLLLEEMS